MKIFKNIKSRVAKGIALINTTLITIYLMVVPTYASGNVSTAIESTWKDAKTQIQSVVDKVVFPAISLILAILFFAKLATAYMDYRKSGQFDFMAPAILFFGLIFSLTAPLYLWNIVG